MLSQHIDILIQLGIPQTTLINQLITSRAKTLPNYPTDRVLILANKVRKLLIQSQQTALEAFSQNQQTAILLKSIGVPASKVSGYTNVSYHEVRALPRFKISAINSLFDLAEIAA